MAPPSIVGALIGGYLSGVLPGDVLLFAIAAVLLYSAFELLRNPRPKPRPEGHDGGGLDIPAAVVTGFVIGILGGIVGLILGSLRMPALVKIVGEVPARAVGTNVTIGFLVGVAGVDRPPAVGAAGLGRAGGGSGRLDPGRPAGLAADRPPVRRGPAARRSATSCWSRLRPCWRTR